MTTSHLSSPVNNDDLLWRHLKTVPAFRALLRAVEARFYQHIDLPGPVLDLGCGDGHFSQMTFDEPLTAGVDPWWGPLNKAQKSGMYQHLTQGLGDFLPFPDNHFGTIISNSVLEHIPDIQAVLNDAGRVLQPGGKLVITMPSHLFTEQLGGAEFFEKLGANGLADQYRRFFNFIARHEHTDTPEVWAERLTQAGFSVERWQYYFSRQALHALEWGHVQGLPSAILHALTGHWILGPWEDNLKRIEQWVRPYFEEEFQSEGTYIFFVACKTADGPIEASLPAARPFSIAELETKIETAPERAASTRSETEFEISSLQSPLPNPPVNKEITQPKISPHLIPAILIIASLICAIIGQAILSAGPLNPTSGLRWYGFSLIPLLFLVWRQRRIDWSGLPQISFPRPGEIPRQRWYYLLAIFLAFLAQRIVNNASTKPQSGMAIILWFAAIAIAFYALYSPRTLRFTLNPSRFTIITSAMLFLTAYIVRAVGLSSHPFILNGAEASVGLDVLNIAEGLSLSPFSTGWLTNPTLLYYLMVWPLRFLGPSTLSIRLLSPLIGATTVMMTYWIGQRLWGQMVGLIAAVLLLGSHFHLHYSRLGMTNIWDPMLVFLALGVLGLAIKNVENSEAEEEHGRLLWLMSGVVIGLNAYVFTGSHLLPLMLISLIVLSLLFNWETVKGQWRHILAASAMALVIALPQLIYYNNNPTIFLERANELGILDDQTGWLAQESARSGSTRGEVLRDQLAQAALSFNYGLDKSGSYRPERPLLGFGMAVLFVLGLVLATIRVRQFRYSILLVWVAIPIIFGGTLLIESPSSHRLVIAAPALALLAAIGLAEIGQLATANIKQSDEATISQTVLLPLLLGITMFLALSDITFYFGTYRQQHSFADRNTEIADNVADYLNTLDGETWTAYFYGPPSMYIGFPTIPFLVEDFHPGQNLYDVDEPNENLAPSQNDNFTFIFLPERAGEIEETRGMYPNGRLQTFSGYHADPLFFSYEVTK